MPRIGSFQVPTTTENAMKRFAIPLIAILMLALCAPCAFAEDAAVHSKLSVNLSNVTLANIPPSAAVITVSPETAKEHSPIVATLNTEIPAGARVYGNGWVFSDGVQALAVSPTVMHVWAGPGQHTAKYNGVWVHTEQIEILDSSGAKRTIESLLGMGMIDATASFTVEGGDDDPIPPVPVPGALSVLLSYESGDQVQVNQAQADIMTNPALRAYLDSHCTVVDGQPAWRFLDLSQDTGANMPAAWQAVIARARGKTTPWLIIDNGKATYEGPCPTTADAMLAKLKEFGGK